MHFDINDVLRALLCGATPDGAEAAKRGGLRSARLRAIKDDIEAHLGDAALCIGMITARHAISERYVQALFVDEETTFTDFVRQQRLNRVYRDLSDSRLINRSISTIAYDWGFSDLSYFNRLFRQKYGMTPSDARNR